jgi:hypothetical protein
MIEAYRLANVLIQVSLYVGHDDIADDIPRRIANPPLSPYSINLANPRHPPNAVTNA